MMEETNLRHNMHGLITGKNMEKLEKNLQLHIWHDIGNEIYLD